jgi:ABC-2 type transport system permease protein
MDRETRILFGKEWRQLTASRGAMATAALIPAFMLGVVPALLSLAAAAPQKPGHDELPAALRFGLFGELEGDVTRLPGAILPLMVAIAGMILPTALGTHLLITERERRTLELLVALPVRIEQVLLAKLCATLAAACALTVPLLALDVVVLPLRGAASLEQVIALPVLLVAALSLSTSIALLMALLAKDFRTANSLGGAFLAPTIVLTMLASFALPGGIVRPLVIALLYGVAALLVTRHALRTVTFERLLT